MANETTTKFKADISELKKQFQEAKRQIKLANSEFKASTSEMDKWSSSADGISAKLKQLNSVLDAQKSQLSSLEKQYELVVAEQGENSRGAEELKIKINNQRAAIGETEKQIRNYNTQLTEMQSENQQAKTAMDNLKDTINQQEQDLIKLKDRYSNLTLEQGENSDEAQELAQQIENLSGELQDNRNKLNQAESAADEFDQSLEDVGNGGLSVFGVALGNLIADVVSMAINKMKELATETINVGKQFDSSMSKVAAVSGATGEEYDQLRDKAKEMGSTTKFTASEAADAFNYMAMAGWKTEDMLDGIDGILNLAAASGSDLGTTSDIVTDALTAMGYKAEDAGKLADVMAAASSNANTNVEMMGNTFKYAAPLVGALGYSMEDTAVAIGLMANAGIKGDQAGTSLRSMLTRLSAPPKECAKEMENLGVSLTDSEGNMKSLDQIMQDLREAFDGLTETEQTAAAKHIAGQQGMSGLLAIVNAAPEDFDKLTNAVADSEGAAKKMADTMLNNLGGDMTLLSSKLEGVQLAIYEKFEPALRKGVEILDKLLDAVQFVIDHSDEFVAVLTGMAAALGTYLAYTTIMTVMTKGWQALTIVTKAQAAAQAALNFVMSLNPIGLVIAAIAGLVAAFVVLWNKSEGFREFWIGLWEKIKEVAGVVWEAISGFFSAAWDKVKEIWGGITEFFSGLWESIKSIFSTIASWINENVFQPIIEYFQPVIDFFTTAWNIISELAKGCWELIKIVWSIVAPWINQHVIQPVKNFFTTMWNSIKIAASVAWEAIKKIWNIVSGWFNKTIIIPVKNFFDGMWDKLKSGAKDAWEGIKSVFGKVADWFEEKFSNAWQKVKDVFSTGGKVFDGIKDGIVDAFKTVVNAIIRGINNVVAIPFNAINNTLDRIRDIEIAGYSPFDGLISRFDVPQIPELAKGIGVAKKGHKYLLEGNGAEAVVPLEKNTGWLDEIANRLYNKMDLPKQFAMAGPQTTTTVNNFYQTNNSPKALSRLEIYRQSKNLLRMKR